MTVLNYINKYNIFTLISRTHFIAQDFMDKGVKAFSEPLEVRGYNKNNIASRNIYYFMFMALTHGAHVIAGCYFNEGISMALVMLLGGILQGYSGCISQIKLDEIQKNNPKSLRGFLSGAVSAAICCYATSAVNTILPETIFRPAKDILSEIILLSFHEKITLGNAKKWFYGDIYQSSDKDDYKGMCWLENLFIPRREYFKNLIVKDKNISCCAKS